MTSKTTDVKLLFTPFDGRPSFNNFKRFEAQLKAHGSTANAMGCSLAQCLYGEDDCPYNPKGPPWPGLPNNVVGNVMPHQIHGQVLGPVPPGGGAAPVLTPAGGAHVPGPHLFGDHSGPLGGVTADDKLRVRAYNALLKNSFAYLVLHIDNPGLVERLTEQDCNGNGPRALEVVRKRCAMLPDAEDTEDLKETLRGLSIAVDVGFAIDTVEDADALLDRHNVRVPLGERFSDDELAQKLLRMLMTSSKEMSMEANKELNAVEGVPGQPGVRLFQLAVPAAGGPRPRDRSAMVTYFAKLWRTAVKAKQISPAVATGRKPPVKQQGLADRGFAVGRERNTASRPSTRAPLAAPSQAEALYQLTNEFGIDLQRSTETTTDWNSVPSEALQAALRDSGELDDAEVASWEERGWVLAPNDEGELSLVLTRDSEGADNVNIICTNCRGVGHYARLCPSKKEFRSHRYVADANALAADAADARGARGVPQRPLPRGQASIKPGMPRRFQASHPHARTQGRPQQPSRPFRKFGSGSSSGGSTQRGSARAAGEVADEYDYECEESEPVQLRQVSEREKAKAVSEQAAALDQTPVAAVRDRGSANEAQPPLEFKIHRESDYFEDHAVERGRAAAEAVVRPSKLAPSSATPPSAKESSEALVQLARDDKETERLSPRVGRCMAIGAAFAGSLLFVLFLTISSLVGLTSYVADSVDRLVCGFGMGLITIGVLLVGFFVHARGAVAPTTAMPVFDPSGRLPSPAFEFVEKAYAIGANDWTLDINESASPKNGSWREGSPSWENLPNKVEFCVDSGATSWVISEEDAWMLSEITDTNPKIGLEAASNTAPMTVKLIGKINSGGVDSVRLVLRTFVQAGDGSKLEHSTDTPVISRVLVVENLRHGTRLASVQTMKCQDRIMAYFNDDNAAGIDNCIKVPSGGYALFTSERNCTIEFEVCAPEAALEQSNRLAKPGRMSSPTSPAAVGERVNKQTLLSIHAGLMHSCEYLVRKSGFQIRDEQSPSHTKWLDMSKFSVSATDCRGCRLASGREPRMTSSAPSLTSRRRPPTETRTPSTANYTHFGQRFDADLCTSFPKSWPHGFTTMMDVEDRHTAEFFCSFLVRPNSSEVVSALEALEADVEGRLPGGKVGMFHCDNDFGIEGALKSDVAERLLGQLSQTVPNESNNPVVERRWARLEAAIRRARGFADDAPECLWPWAVQQAKTIFYFTATRAHDPIMSPYRFSHPEGELVDMSWAKPLFCDVTVHLAKRDIDNKAAYTAAEGCYLGHDFRRNCQIVYLPAMQRIGHFHVRHWLYGSFVHCKNISTDTPVQYREPDDLFYGKATAALLPGRYVVPRAAASTPVDESSLRIREGVEALLKCDQLELVTEVVKEQCALLKSTDDSMLVEAVRKLDEWYDTNTGAEFEIVLIGTETAKATVSNYSSIVKIANIDEAMKSAYWPQIKAGMEKEINGKLANGFAKVVKDEGQRKMKLKWVILVYLEEDGSVLTTKCRLTGCGYSQLPSEYDQISAPTLPGASYRTFCSIVADEDLETDCVDAVKAFTQADLDKRLYSDMPAGFTRPGYILLLLKALEGIKQGSALWYAKNKWAWNKCGMNADPVEPNMYTHPDLQILIAVFADDMGVGFNRSVRAEYLKIRNKYSELIKIDSPGPDVTVPITVFIGTEWTRNRRDGTLKVTQVKYIKKLEKRYEGQFTRNEMPYVNTDKGRKEFEELPDWKEGPCVDRAEYLELMGFIGWPSTTTRPELAYTFSILSKCSMDPRKKQFEAGLHVVGYLVETIEIGPEYGGPLKVPLGLVGFPPNFTQSRGTWGSTDSSWGKGPHPQGGHVVFRCNAAVLWASKTLKLVPMSTAEAETAEGSRATKSGMFFKSLMIGVKRKILGPIPFTGDNQAMHQIVEKDGSSHRTRHFERATVLIKWAVLKLLVKLYLVRSAECVADIFTKAVTKETFMRLRAVLHNLPYRTASTDAAARLASALARLPKRLFG